MSRAFEAVVVGASAGGVDALTTILPRLPAAFPLPLLVVVHVPPTSRSLFPELYGPMCALPVVEAEDKEPIDGGRIYFAPAGYHLLVEPGRTLALSVDPPVCFARPSIDVLFESAAWVYGAGLLGIVLSGANSDGARGLAAIRKAGGTAWVQTPSEAQSSAMPTAAIEIAGADAVLPLHALAERLARCA